MRWLFGAFWIKDLVSSEFGHRLGGFDLSYTNLTGLGKSKLVGTRTNEFDLG